MNAKDMVLETSTTQGTGTVQLAGVTTGYQSFSSAYGATTANIPYRMGEVGGGWEVGEGTYDHAAQTLQRDSVYSSSNAGARVNWGSGTRSVSVSMPSAEVMFLSDALSGIDQAAAFTSLGITSTGSALVTSADASAARASLGSTTVGDAVFVAADASQGRTALSLGSAATRVMGTDSGTRVLDRDALDARYARATTGDKAVFVQSAAPTGWTIDATLNGRMLQVNSASGGTTGGSWTISGLTATTSVSTHALTVNEMPLHTHTVTTKDAVGGNEAGITSAVNLGTPYGSVTTGSQGAGVGHTHGATTTPSSDGTWRPSYVDVIVCTKV